MSQWVLVETNRDFDVCESELVPHVYRVEYDDLEEPVGYWVAITETQLRLLCQLGINCRYAIDGTPVVEVRRNPLREHEI